MADRKEVMSSDSESDKCLGAKVRPPNSGFKPTDLLQGSGNKNSIMATKTAEFSDHFRNKNAYDR